MNMSINFDENEVRDFDRQLRPDSFNEYIGQQNVKSNLKILIQAAKERNEMPEHILFYGPPGIGKTTLAKIIAKELNTNLKTTSGSAIEKVADLAAILSNLEKGDVLFIDEIHRLKKPIEEVLYPAMENGVLDIVIGKGPSARVMQLNLEPFTLVSATTLFSKISAPLRSRFSGGVFHIGFYNKEEIKQIIKNNAEKLQITYHDQAIDILAENSRFTPRFANYLLKRCRDYIQVHNKQILDKNSVIETLNLLGIIKQGLTKRDLQMLELIYNKFSGGPVGLKTLAISLSEEEETIEQIHEPYMIQLGLIKKTPQGRKLTKDGEKFVLKITKNKLQ